MTATKKYLIFIASLSVAAFGAIVLLKYFKRKRNIETELMEANSEIDNNASSQSRNWENYMEGNASSPHFTSAEFACNDGTPVPKKYMGNVQELMNNLEVLRDALGGTPLIINSAYRTESHNASVGGKPGSFHLVAMASDVRHANYTPAQIKAIIESLIKQGKMKQGGIGVYPTFVHYDTRGVAARW